MDHSTDPTTPTFNEPDENMLTYTVSDEALEAAGMERGNCITNSFIVWSDPCCHR
jgi:hypothetical protein